MSMGDEEIKVWIDEYFKYSGDGADGTYEINIGDISLDGSWSSDGRTYEDWLVNSVFDHHTHDNIVLTGGGEEMLRVEKDGFYVRGVKVEADAREAEQVYKAFKEWLAWASLSRNDEE